MQNDDGADHRAYYRGCVKGKWLDQVSPIVFTIMEERDHNRPSFGVHPIKRP
jgi:hypothetical protein